MLICLEVNRLVSSNTKPDLICFYRLFQWGDIFSVLSASFYTRAKGLMLQECRKDGIRKWQHSCVFSLKQPYQVISWPQILLDTFLPHVQSTWWHVTGILECVKGSSIFQTTILCSRHFFAQSQCVKCVAIWVRGNKIYICSIYGHHWTNVDWQYWKLEVWSY